jgi:hypothetical protein
MTRILSGLTISLVIFAIALSAELLLSDTQWGSPEGVPVALLSAAPLLLIGVSFLVAQVMLRPRWTDLLKNILLAATFILWSVVQLLAQNSLSKKLGDVVIALYVVDLAWVILANVDSSGRMRSSSDGSDPASH